MRRSNELRCRTVLVLVASVFGLGACGIAGITHTQFNPMQEAVGGDRARLRVMTTGNPSGGAVWGAPERDCMDWGAETSGTVIGGFPGSRGLRDQSLGMPVREQVRHHDSAEFYVRANQPITLKYMVGSGVYQCWFAVSFVPEKDADYEAFFMGTKLARSCTVNITSLSDPSKVVKVSPAGSCK